MKPKQINVSEYRNPDYRVDPIFVNRWSPRAMSGGGITDSELFSLFEAARWAPSAYNAQPWRFIYAKRDTPAWDKLFNLMVEGNQNWTKNAAVLVVVISRKKMEYKDNPNPTHSLDTGSAWMSIALQGSIQGLVVHGMSGFDYEKAKSELNIPDNYQVEAMFSVGKQGEIEVLPDAIKQREKPSGRKKVGEFAFEGEFKGKN